MNAMSVIDVILSRLARGGPGRGIVVGLSQGEVTDLEKLDFLNLQQIPIVLKKGFNLKTHYRLIPGFAAYEALILQRACLELLYDVLGDKVRCLSIKEQFSLFGKVRDLDGRRFVKYTKYMCTWPIAKYYHQSLPVRPEGFTGHPLFFTGRLKRMLKNRLVSKTKKNAFLWNSYLQGIKRACSPINMEVVVDTLCKHANNMVVDPPIASQPSEDFESKIHSLLIGDKMYVDFRAPTASACIGSLRSEGGKYQKVQELAEGEPSFRMEYHPQRGTLTFQGFRSPSFEEVLAQAEEEAKGRNVSYAIGLSEPLKCRVITKSDAYRSTIARSVQRSLFDRLVQNVPQLCLTKVPVEGFHIEGLFERLPQYMKDLGLMFSGDYSQATDNIHPDYTHVCINAINATGLYRKGSPDIWEQDECIETLHLQPGGVVTSSRGPLTRKVVAILKSMVDLFTLRYKIDIEFYEDHEGQILDSFPEPDRIYDSGLFNKILEYKDITKQLMGQEASFPFLCMINFVAAWTSYERYYGRSIRMCDVPVLINGDDIVGLTNKSHYKIWEECVNEIGWSLSPGKNYLSRDFCTINSQMFVRSGERWSKIEIFNLGLLTNMSKVTGRTNVRNMSLADQFNQIVCYDPKRLIKRFIHYHIDSVAKATHNGNYNLFIDRELGGIGLRSDVNPKYTSFQRRLARFYWTQWKKALNGERDIPVSVSPIYKTMDISPLSYDARQPFKLLPTIGPSPFPVQDYDTRIIVSAEPLFQERKYLEEPIEMYNEPWKMLKEFRKRVYGHEHFENLRFNYKVAKRDRSTQRTEPREYKNVRTGKRRFLRTVVTNDFHIDERLVDEWGSTLRELERDPESQNGEETSS
jgi:hypothetical protein